MVTGPLGKVAATPFWTLLLQLRRVPVLESTEVYAIYKVGKW